MADAIAIILIVILLPTIWAWLAKWWNPEPTPSQLLVEMAFDMRALREGLLAATVTMKQAAQAFDEFNDTLKKIQEVLDAETK